MTTGSQSNRERETSTGNYDAVTHLGIDILEPLFRRHLHFKGDEQVSLPVSSSLRHAFSTDHNGFTSLDDLTWFPCCANPSPVEMLKGDA